MAEDHPFAKDLGYLDRFLEKVRAYAAGLPEGERLARLLDEEARRWAEIRTIIAGEGTPEVHEGSGPADEGQASDGHRAAEGQAAASEPEGTRGKGAAAVRAAPKPPPPAGFTVGSLRG